jgi:hypothetical protein
LAGKYSPATAVLLLGLVASCAPRAPDRSRAAYQPLFGEAVRSVHPLQRGTIAGDFALAAQASTLAQARTNWEAFLAKHLPPGGELEDAVQKRYLDAARLELVRVYYLLGLREEADRLIRQLDPLQLR